MSPAWINARSNYPDYVKIGLTRRRGFAWLRRHFRADGGPQVSDIYCKYCAATAEIGCSEDLAYSQHQIRAAGFAAMFLRKTQPKKDGKTHEYWSVVENSVSWVAVSCSVTCCIWARW
jgi:hypothetical protein